VQPSNINPLSLPSVSLEQRSQLPTKPCIYFAIDSQGVVQYIGRSNNPRNRWQSHHKGIELALMGGVQIAYLESAVDLMPEIERALITYFCPPLNQAVHEKPPVEGMMRVVKTISVDVPDLGQQIRAAREADGRPLVKICAEVGMTPANWYRIEAEKQTLLLETLKRIEEVLGVDFGVKLEEIAA